MTEQLYAHSILQNQNIIYMKQFVYTFGIVM